MHPLQIVAMAVLGILLLVLGAGAFLALYLAFFGDTIKCTGENSRLLRWPKAIKKGWNDFWDVADTVTSGSKAREAMRDICASD